MGGWRGENLYFCNNFRLFWKDSHFKYFCTFLIPRKFLDFREISTKFENVASETLFSEANILSNICRIEMKSTWSDGVDSEVLEQFSGTVVGPFAPDQNANNMN